MNIDMFACFLNWIFNTKTACLVFENQLIYVEQSLH